jgi:hypothetical protein
VRVTQRYDGHGRLTGTTVSSRWGCLSWFGMLVAVVAAFSWPAAVIPGWPRWLAEGAWLTVILAVFVALHRQHRNPNGGGARPASAPPPDDPVKLPNSWDDPHRMI